jgi:hypothetical protein
MHAMAFMACSGKRLVDMRLAHMAARWHRVRQDGD